MERLHETFVRLCEIRSPTGEEREVADTIAAELRALGLEVSEDDAAGPAEAGSGNLLARLPGSGERWLMFCAHMDTVPHRGQVEVVDDEGVFRSRGETILGADNKAAVAVFMELAARAAEAAEPPAVGIELLLHGRRGAGAARREGLRHLARCAPSCGFVLDHAGPVGEVIVATPTQQKIRRRLRRGRGPRRDPARGRQQRDRRRGGGDRADGARAGSTRTTTANVGLIEGGTSGNVVPGHCGIVAETRSLDAERAAEVAGEMTEACAWGASEHGCDVDVQVEELFRGYELPKDSPALALAEAGLRGAGLEPERVAIGGGSDANALRLDGFDCVLLANGTERRPHRRRAGVGERPRHDARGLRGDRRGRREPPRRR